MSLTRKRLARQLTDQHGLTAWKLVWNRAKDTHGLCDYRTMTITLSEAMQHVSDQDYLDTVLHEIAHALVGPGHAHGYVWRRQCLAIGGNGQQYVSKAASAAVKATAPWEGRCPKCTHVTRQHRAPLRVKACRCGVRFRPEHVLVWHKDGRRVPLGQMPVRFVTEAIRMRAQFGDRLSL